MAYVFKRIQSLLPAEQGRKSDILSQPAQGAPQEDREQLAGRPAGPSAVLSPGTPAAGGKAASVAEATQVSSEARDKVFQKNKDANLIADTEKTSGAIRDASEGLKKEADAYGKEVSYARVEEPVVTKATEGDEESKKAVEGLLYGEAPKPREFAYDDSSLEPLEDEVKSWGTTGGRQALIQSRTGGSAGEALLDAALLGRSDAFKKQQQEVVQQFAGFRGETEQASKKAGEDVAEAGKSREEDKARVRKALEGLAQGVKDDISKRKDGENKSRKEFREKAEKEAENRAIEALKEANELEGSEGWFRDYLPVGVDVKDFLRFDAGDVDDAGVTTQAEAERFARIAELLGSGERLAPKQTNGPSYTFDKERFLAAIRERKRAMARDEAKSKKELSPATATTPAEVDLMKWANPGLQPGAPVDQVQGGAGNGVPQFGNTGKSAPDPWAPGDTVQANRDDPKTWAKAIEYSDGLDQLYRSGVTVPEFRKAAENNPALKKYERQYADYVASEIGREARDAGPVQRDSGAMWTPDVSGGGGKHLCGAMYRLGHLPAGIYAADLRYALSVPADVKAGYTLWALPLSQFIERNPWSAPAFLPFVRAWANEMAGNNSPLGRFLKQVGEPLCGWLGRMFCQERKVA